MPHINPSFKLPTLPSDKRLSVVMKYCFAIFTGIFYILPLRAQINLVKNPGFEQYWRCLDGTDQIKNANYWSPSDTLDADSATIYPMCSPEYCNTCDSLGIVSVPHGGAFYQYPHSGNGMAQVQMFANIGILDTGAASYLRDYLQGRLKAPLIAGQQYCVSFYVVLEEASAFSTNKMGAYLDDGSMDTATWCAWPQTSHIPQVYTNDIINDTMNWHKIEGSFIANGTERFITIGNFFDSAHTNKIACPPNFFSAGNTLYTLYLIDDVAVIPMDAHADAGPDQWVSPGSDSAFVGTTDGYLPCLWYANGVLIDSNIAGFKVHPTVITSYVMVLDVCGNITTDTVMVYVAPLGLPSPRPATKERGLSISVWPNPTSGIVNLEGVDGCYVSVYDMVGQLCGIESHVEPNRTTTFNSALLPKGVYSVVITDPVSGEKVVKRVIKE